MATIMHRLTVAMLIAAGLLLVGARGEGAELYERVFINIIGLLIIGLVCAVGVSHVIRLRRSNAAFAALDHDTLRRRLLDDLKADAEAEAEAEAEAITCECNEYYRPGPIEDFRTVVEYYSKIKIATGDSHDPR